jgi:hypothetical protein
MGSVGAKLARNWMAGQWLLRLRRLVAMLMR